MGGGDGIGDGDGSDGVIVWAGEPQKAASPILNHKALVVH